MKRAALDKDINQDRALVAFPFRSRDHEARRLLVSATPSRAALRSHGSIVHQAIFIMGDGHGPDGHHVADWVVREARSRPRVRRGGSRPTRISAHGSWLLGFGRTVA